MSGPRDLRRGARKLFEQADPKDAIGGKNHFIIARWGQGWAITVKRRGHAPETILCQTPGEVNQQRQRLSAAGLIGWSEGAL